MKNKIRTISYGSIALLLIASLTLFVNCGKSENVGKVETKKKKALMVVFSTGATVVRGEKQFPAEVGKLVFEGDTVKTQKGFVDLQTREGSAIRISNFTTVAISKLVDGDTTIDMEHGTVLAKVKRKSSSENFTVSTPTAIAGVRGTTFKVEKFDETEAPRVKVFDGKVAMTPRVKVLEKYSAEEIEANPALKKLAATVSSAEVVIDQEQEGVLPDSVEQKVKEINQAVAAAEASGQKVENIEKVAAVQEFSTVVESKKGKIIVEKAPLSVQDVHQAGTLVAVDEATFDKVAAKPATSVELADAGTEAEAVKSVDVVELKKLHQKKRLENQEKIIAKIEAEASSKKLKNEEEIKKQYNKLEMVILKDGGKIKGAVIATTDDLIVIHTKDGVKRISKQSVDSQEMLY